MPGLGIPAEPLFRSDLTGELSFVEVQREPSAEELADMLEIPSEEVETTLGVAARHVSMDAPFVEGEDNSLLDVLENSSTPDTDKALEYNESLSREIIRSLNTLTERQCDVIKLYFARSSLDFGFTFVFFISFIEDFENTGARSHSLLKLIINSGQLFKRLKQHNHTEHDINKNTSGKLF